LLILRHEGRANDFRPEAVQSKNFRDGQGRVVTFSAAQRNNTSNMPLPRKTYLSLGCSLLLLFSLLVGLPAHRGKSAPAGEVPVAHPSADNPVKSAKMLNDFHWNFISRGILHITA
jgi:hypothetical protein